MDGLKAISSLSTEIQLVDSSAPSLEGDQFVHNSWYILNIDPFVLENILHGIEIFFVDSVISLFEDSGKGEDVPRFSPFGLGAI